MIDQWLQSLSAAITQNGWIAPLLAFAAGILTAFTPCSLSSLPLVIGYLGGTANADTKRSFKLSLVLALGMAITYTALGVAVSLIGRLLIHIGSWWFILLGVLMVLMALQVWEVIHIIPSTYLQSKNTKRGYIGALLTGILSGLFCSPCATPVLVVLLSAVASRGNILWGILLLLFYSLGHSVLVLTAGISMGFVRKITSSEKYGKVSTVLKIITGILILLLAVYMLYLGF